VAAMGGRDSSGPVVRTITLDQQPIDAVVAERSGRAFILTADGPVGPFASIGGVARGNGRVRVFDTATGAQVTARNAGYQPCAAVADEKAGHVFVAYSDADTIGGGVLMLDATSGAPLRTVPTDAAPCGGAPVVDGRAGRAFFNGGDDSLSTVDTGSGRLVHTFHAYAGGNMNLAPDERDGRVFATLANNGTVEVFAAPTGLPLGAITLGDAPALPGLAADARLSLVADPGAGRLLVVDRAASTVRTVDTRSYAVRRGAPVALNPAAWALDGEGPCGRLLVGGDTTLSIVDTCSGAVTHLLILGEQTSRILVDAPAHRAFVLTRDHLGSTPRVWIVDTRRGTLVSAIMLSGVPASAAVDARHGRVVIVDQQGTIDILDARAGRLIRTVGTVPSPVTAVVVDAANGHAFVLHGNGILAVPDRWAWMPAWLREKLTFLPPPGVSYRNEPPGVTVVDDTR